MQLPRSDFLFRALERKGSLLQSWAEADAEPQCMYAYAS